MLTLCCILLMQFQCKTSHYFTAATAAAGTGGSTFRHARRVQNGVYTSGFSINGQSVMMGKAIFSSEDIAQVIDIVNDRSAYSSVDQATRRVKFSLENCRDIVSTLLRAHNNPRLTCQICSLLKKKALPLVMGADGVIVLRDGYSYRERTELNSAQQQLVMESLSEGHGPHDTEGGLAYCLENDPLFPLDLNKYGNTARSRMASIRVLDRVYYDALLALAFFVKCGRTASTLPGTCDRLFRGSFGSLALAPVKCSVCNFMAENGRAHVIVDAPPICRMCYAPQHFFQSVGDVSRTICTCNGPAPILALEDGNNGDVPQAAINGPDHGNGAGVLAPAGNDAPPIHNGAGQLGGVGNAGDVGGGFDVDGEVQIVGDDEVEEVESGSEEEEDGMESEDKSNSDESEIELDDSSSDEGDFIDGVGDETDLRRSSRFANAGRISYAEAETDDDMGADSSDADGEDSVDEESE